MYLITLSGKCRPFCLGLNVLNFLVELNQGQASLRRQVCHHCLPRRLSLWQPPAGPGVTSLPAYWRLGLGHSRLMPMCCAFFIQRGHRRSLPILRRNFFLIGGRATVATEWNGRCTSVSGDCGLGAPNCNECPNILVSTCSSVHVLLPLFYVIDCYVMWLCILNEIFVWTQVVNKLLLLLQCLVESGTRITQA